MAASTQLVPTGAIHVGPDESTIALQLQIKSWW